MMERIIDYPIRGEEGGLRIRQILRRRGYSRQNMIELKKIPASVQVNGIPKHFPDRVLAGDTLRILIRETESSPVVPRQHPLDILYEDEDLIVINKPAGMPTHPSYHNVDNSLASALCWYYGEQGIPFVFRCCNRLDRDTSGVIVVSKHFVSAGILSTMGAERRIRREYLAVVRGTDLPAEGTIDAPLGRLEGSIIERTVDFEHGERAVTHYRVERTGNGHSLLRLKLETGRTHQIRIHLKYLGYPIVGDYLYNPDMEFIGRQALHSCRMAFAHPVTGEEMCFTAPLPEDMEHILNYIKEEST